MCFNHHGGKMVVTIPRLSLQFRSVIRHQNFSINNEKDLKSILIVDITSSLAHYYFRYPVKRNTESEAVAIDAFRDLFRQYSKLFMKLQQAISNGVNPENL